MEESSNMACVDLDDIVADFETLKISALKNAAKVSPHVTEVTIGPRSKSISYERNIPEQSFNLKITINNSKVQKSKIDPFNTNYKDDILNENDNTRSVEIVDYKAIEVRSKLNDVTKKSKENVKKDIARRHAKVIDHSKIRQERYEENVNRGKRNNLLKMEEQEKQLLKEAELYDLKAKKFDEEQKIQLEAKKENLKQKSIQLKNEEETRLVKQYFQEISQNQLQYKKLNEILIQNIKTKDPNRIIYRYFKNDIKEISDLNFKLINNCKDGIITKNEIQWSEKLLENIEAIIKGFDTEYEKLNKKLENDKRELEEKEAKLKLDEELERKQRQDVVDSKTKSFKLIEGISQFISPNRFEYYIRLKQYYDQYSDSITPLVKDDSLKKFRFDCQKAINIPVNAISGVNAQHIQDKFQRLSQLLSGTPVKIGENVVTAGSHPLGQKFCMLLLAKKFVNQADTMISSNAQAAYPIASILVALCQQFPELHDLFLAHIYKECPYLVPYFIPQLEGQTVEEYYTLLGYRYVDGKLEKQDMYLKRMSGIIRLYSSLLITKPRRGETKPHPHNIENGYIWLCNILNLDPLPDICATLILEFLQVAGSTLIKIYGKQFLKVLKLIKDDYFIKLNKIDEGGPKARLEAFLMNVFKDGRIDEPDGILENNFW